MEDSVNRHHKLAKNRLAGETDPSGLIGYETGVEPCGVRSHIVLAKKWR